MAITPTAASRYKERVAAQSGQSIALGISSGITTREYILDGTASRSPVTTNEILGTVPTFLGTAVTQAGTPPTLHRTLPLQDPQFQNFWCTKIYDGRGIGRVTDETSGYQSQPHFPGYESFQFTAQFEQVPYVVISDVGAAAVSALLGGPAAGYPVECMRWFSWEVVPDAQVLQLQAGSLKYAETSTASGSVPAGPTITGNGTPVVGIQALIQPKTKINWKWYDVPEDFISSQFGVYDHFDAAVGHVNSVAFLGFPVGTLLMEPYQVVRKKYTSLDGVDYFLCDLTIPMIYYNPPNGKSTSTYAGHNLLPYRGNFLYYYATVTGATGARPTYTDYDFTKLFEHHST